MGPTTLVTEALLMAAMGGVLMVSGLVRGRGLVGRAVVGRGMPLGATMPAGFSRGVTLCLGGRGGTTAQLGGTLPGRDSRLASDSVGNVVLARFSTGSPLSSLLSSGGLENYVG